MMNLISVQRCLLISIAFVVGGKAFAADAFGDAQAQARALLIGTSVARLDSVGTPNHQRLRKPEVTAIDPQEQARDLLLGTDDSSQITGRSIADQSKAESNSAPVTPCTSANFNSSGELSSNAQIAREPASE